MTDPPYTMRVDLSVLESLGINLYSNAAAVLSELVANAYDADATEVAMEWKNTGDHQQVIVSDNGSGMTAEELDRRFLTVGYKKRTEEGLASPRFGRPFMGRKGIGKLSVFSIAKRVSVYSVKDGTASGLVIDVDELQEAIRAADPYHPSPVEVPKEYAAAGTTLVLAELKGKRSDLTASALRKRLARRFDVLDQRTPDEGGFRIKVNGEPLTYADRQELKKIEFIWEFGPDRLPDEVLPAGVTRFALPGVIDHGRSWAVSGWFGTARRPTDLTDDEESGSLKNIIVLARKRPIQEGIVEKLDFSRIFGNYVTGQVEADFLDLDDTGYDDIATSDRQRLIEDDERVLALQAFLREAFVKAADQWSDARPKKEAEDLLGSRPQLVNWINALPAGRRDAARRMLGTIAALPLEKKAEGSRNALYRAGVLAFERVALREATEELDQLTSLTAEDLLPLLAKQDDYEAALWADILRSRVEAIGAFQGITLADQREKVLQEHLFQHLWLIDPAWERATASERMEENLRRVDPGILATDAEGQELTGRFDIRYATASGTHVIVELKRYSVNADIDNLVEQGRKYYSAMTSILEQQNRAGEPIEVVFVLGKEPTARGAAAKKPEEYVKDMLANIKGRYVLYDQLIENASRQYEDYLAASKKSQDLEELLAVLVQATDD